MKNAQAFKATQAHGGNVVEPLICAGIAGVDCSLSADSPDARKDLELIFELLRTFPGSNPRRKLSLIMTMRRCPALRATEDNHVLNLGEIFTAPNQKRFAPIGDRGNARYADLFLSEEPALEIAGGEMLIFNPNLLSYYASMAFFWLIDRNECFVYIHSAVLAINNHPVMLVGPSKCGKSTLSYALQKSGATYYGDESAIFLPPNYELYPWPRPICLRPGGYEVLGSPLESPDWYRIRPDDPKCKISLPEPAQPCPRDKASFFFLDGFTDAPKISAMPGGEATRRLLQGMSCAEQSIGGRLEIAADLVNRYPSYRLAVGPPHETAALVMAHMRGQG